LGLDNGMTDFVVLVCPAACTEGQMEMVGALPKLDRIDIRILSYLQQHGRATNVELAEAVGLSASPCLTRVKRLEKSGYIIGYGAQIQMQKLADTLTVFTEVTLADHRAADFARFEARIRSLDEVVECYLVSGGYDYLLKFMTRNIQHYQDTIEYLLSLGIGITKYFSYVVIKQVFAKHHLPLESFIQAKE
jgi:DNA-binding Lrp family transcriptional regulator